ncbi:protein of unknown function (plasmid) [Cupriavidus taiwanensis]|nr:protein of unknown function [Cupriavidus taiwanensis]SOZ72053.1 protein of unknown function [Cupriavidus taiwanensis]SPA03282.1 protein of unknown function [Cupriavidus taiwanensis]SPA11260.1 protein of unknown function [Cupriavidus taiwanensis]SPA57225.1 protein of unknown function [Cupriavidus taiwanensis]
MSQRRHCCRWNNANKDSSTSRSLRLGAEQLAEPELNRGGSAPRGSNFDRVLGVVQ